MAEVTELDNLLHELINYANMFKSYSLFLSNSPTNIKKIQSVCDKCHDRCLDIKKQVTSIFLKEE